MALRFGDKCARKALGIILYLYGDPRPLEKGLEGCIGGFHKQS